MNPGSIAARYNKNERFITVLRHAHSLYATILMLSCLATGGSSRAIADTAVPQPFYSFNQSPLIQIHGLPALGEARVLGPGASMLAAHMQLSNHFTGSSHGVETLSLDGETRRLTLQWRQGLPGNREWGFELPYVSHNGGFLDRSIEEFHDLFGMPQNGRTELPRKRIDFRYARNGTNLVNLNRAVSGAGDVRLSAAMPYAGGNGHAAVWRASLKLPTGDEGELLGSGSTDLAGWLSAATTRPPDKWNVYGGGGMLLMSQGEVLPAQQRHVVIFGSFGISQKFSPQITINAQLDAHSPFYNDSGLRQLGRNAVQGLIGADWEFAPKKSLALSISEDFVVGASPDVAFNLSLTLPF